MESNKHNRTSEDWNRVNKELFNFDSTINPKGIVLVTKDDSQYHNYKAKKIMATPFEYDTGLMF